MFKYKLYRLINTHHPLNQWHIHNIITLIYRIATGFDGLLFLKIMMDQIFSFLISRPFNFNQLNIVLKILIFAIAYITK